MAHSPHPAAPDKGPWAFDNTSKLVAIVIGVISVIVGYIVGMVKPFLNHAASAQGARIDMLFSVTLGIAATIFVIVQGFLLYSVLRFGRQPDDDTDAAPIRGNHRLEFFWTAIPAIIVVFVGLLSYQVLADIERPKPDEMVVEVTARGFSWEFYYPEQDVKSSDLHLPVDRQVRLKLRSADVLHSFWVPAFRIKKDTMPDRVTETFVTATETGEYPIVCAELCGAGHASMGMVSKAIVESDADFQSWLASRGVAQAQAAAAAASDPLAAGKAAFTTYGCNACHALAAADAVGAVGPKLDGIGARAGSAVAGQSAEDFIRTSITQPGVVLTPNFQDIMPKDLEQRMTPDELNAMVKFLVEQK